MALVQKYHIELDYYPVQCGPENPSGVSGMGGGRRSVPQGTEIPAEAR